MTINELIADFGKHVEQYGLNGDPGREELYKWEIISKYHDKLDTENDNFAQNISEINFLNLWYPSKQHRAMLSFAKYEPEKYRMLHRALYDESQPLQDRVTAFKQGCDELWDSKIKQHFPNKETDSACDERIISDFLATKYPDKYTFYKYDAYINLCDLFGEEPKNTGEKLVHFYELMDEHVIPLVKADVKLCGIVEAEVSQHNYIQSLPLIAQTVIWHAMSAGKFNKRQLWLFWAGDSEEVFDDMVKDSYLSVYEWGEIGDLEDLRTQKTIRKALKEKVEEYKTTEPGHSVKMLYDMKNNMNVGDFIVCRNKSIDKIIAVGEVTGGYFYNPDHHCNNHCVEVKWNKGDWDITKILSQSKDSISGSPRLQNVTKKDWGQKMMAVLEGITDMEPTEIKTAKDMETNKYIELLKECKNMVLTGAPGTGKTYLAKQIAKDMGAEWKMVQFHPSYDYTDFVEGLRPVKDASGNVAFERKDGVFKKFCKRALLASETSTNEDVFEGLNDSPTVWKVSLAGTGDNPVRTECLKNNHIRIGWDMYGDVEDFDEFEGWTKENSGKAILRTFQHGMNIGDIVVSCFSSKTTDAIGIVTGDYEYHAEGGEYPRYRAVRWIYQGEPLDITAINQNKTMTLSTVYKLSCTSQDIIKLVNANIVSKYHIQAPSKKPFVFIIDEINRGEISKIFGELFFSIEPSYRGEENKVDTQYQEMVEEDDVFKKGFFVPENVYVIGTMNDIDRSVESMDFAMRRRFTWQEITADESAVNMGISGEARNRMDALNNAIAETDGLGRDFQIGGAIFLGQTDMEKLWRLHLNSLLHEYLRGMPDEEEKFNKLKDAFDLKTTADE